MIADREHLRLVEPEPARDFGQRRAFIVGNVTEPGIHIVAHHRQVRHAAGVVCQVLMDDVCVAVVPGDAWPGRNSLISQVTT